MRFIFGGGSILSYWSPKILGRFTKFKHYSIGAFENDRRAAFETSLDSGYRKALEFWKCSYMNFLKGVKNLT